MADKLATTTDAAFEADVLNSDTPVLIDFWATWCGPCRAMTPHLESVSDEMGDKLRVLKVDIQENPATPAKYGVTAVPTLLLFKGGEVVAKQMGAMNLIKLREFVSPHVS